MDPDAVVALAVAVLTKSSSDMAQSLRLDESDTLQTQGPHLERQEHTVAILDALAGVCAREKGSMVAIGLRMGKPVEIILATNDEYPSETIINHLTTVCSTLKKISDRKFCSQFSETDVQKVTGGDFNDSELQDLHDKLFLEIYKYSYDKLEIKHAKWWSIFEEFRAQSLDWVQKMKQEGGQQENMAEFVKPYQSVFRDLVLFRANSVAFQNSLFECCQTEKVGSTQMQLLKTGWHRMLICAQGILDDSSACEYWATMVATDEPPLQLRQAIEKLVAFHRHIFTLIQFASSPRMRSKFFSTEITVTSVQKKGPALLKWPSNESGWMDLLSTIYMKQDLERETGQKAISSEQKVAKRATENGRAATIHCECAVVAYLHRRGYSPAFSYIGASKLSCKPSYHWIKAYNQIAGTAFRTKGTNNKWCKRWARPGLGKAEVEKKVEAGFLELVESELCKRQIGLGMAGRRSASSSPDSSERMVVSKGPL